MLFEPDSAFLRHIRLGDHEVVRALYAAVRDEDWSTVPSQITIREQVIQSDSFRLAFEARCRLGPVEYAWQGVMTGEPSGRIRFTFDGLANSDFRRNRIGICILHPILECAGRPVAVEHVDGTTEQGNFPRDISPHQPFFDIRGLAYEVAATRSRWKISATGRTPRSSLIARPWHSPCHIRSRPETASNNPSR